MQVATYHRERGDLVYIYDEHNHNSYDKIYTFSLFNFTDKKKVRSDMLCGGTGFDYTIQLPPEIAKCDYDWSLYCDCDHSIIWFSRGCIRNCPFCIVQDKEGIIHPVEPKNLNPNGKYIKVMDNNFFANPEWELAVDKLKEWNQKVKWDQGIDVRILTDDMCDVLNKIKRKGQIHFAWDNPKENLLPKIEWFIERVRPYKLACFVLIGYWSTEKQDIERIEALRNLKIDPFIMPFDKFDPYQKALTRYVAHKAIFKSHTWEQYKEKYKVPDGPKTLEEGI